MIVNILYHSKYGNGKKLMEHLQTILKKKGHDARLYPITELKPPRLPPGEFYIFSTPTHIGGPPGKVKKFLKQLEVKEGGGNYSLITTTMDAKGKTLQKMDELLRTKGLTNISDGLSIMVSGFRGPLEEGYSGKLEAYASEVLSAL